MQFRVLGSLEVLNDAGDVAGVGGTTQRRLLAVLLVEAGSVVSVDRLCDVLAVSEPALRTAVSRLRRAIGDTHLVTEPPGYRLAATAIDAARFRELCRDARHAPPDRAVDLLDAALDLWRGDAFAEFADQDWVHPETVSLAEQRADAIEDRAEALIAIGRYGDAVASLERHNVDQPLRDRPTGLTMRALAAQGRQAEALRIYQEHYRYLADELGTQPSTELVELERRIAGGWHDSPPEQTPTTQAAVPSGTVTFLFTDVEGSTRLWENHRDHMRTALARHDQIIRAAIGAHDGFVFHTGGDAFGAAFARADDAVAASTDIQRALTAADWEGPALRSRIAVHTGETEERDGNYFGPAVNQVARLRGIGHGGQVLVSATTAALLDGSVELTDLGEHRLKDLAAPLRVFQLHAEGLHDSFPALTSLDATPTNLPILLTSFVGRTDEVTRLADLVRDHRLVTLVGPGGIGKTRLAVHVAATLADRFPDGVWLVELAPLDDPAAVPQVIASTLAVPETARRSLTEDIVAFLRSQTVLVILDNCEHVVDAVAAVARAVVSACPTTTVLATSREGLAVDGEQVWPVPPLGAADAAIELFRDRARGVALAFQADEHRNAVGEICRRLDGVPLAIELAATRVQSLAPADIARLLDDRFRLLTAGRRSSRERHRSLRATVEWSYDLLGEQEQLLFGRLSVFSGWFDLAAAQAVGGGPPLDPFAVIEGLERLVEQSMVVVEDRPSGRRYRLLETLRQFALERLALVGVDAVTERHASHYRDWIEWLRDELRGPDEVRALADLDDGWDNLRTAHLWAIDHDDTDTALRISAALVWECWWRHRFEASVWARAAVELQDAADHPAIVEALVTVARALMIQFHVEEYAAAVERATTAHHQHGGPEPISLLFAQETLYWFAGDLDGLGQQMHTILATARARNDRLAEAHALADLSALQGLLMEPGRFVETAERGNALAAEALVIASTVGNPTMCLWADQHLVGWMDDSERKLMAVRPVARRASELRNLMALTLLRSYLAELEVKFGDLQTGVMLYREHLRHLIDAEAWWGWPFIGTGVLAALAAIGAHRSAAVLLGELEDRLTVTGMLAQDASTALTILSQHLSPGELAELLTKGSALAAADAAPLALAEFDAYLADAAQPGLRQT